MKILPRATFEQRVTDKLKEEKIYKQKKNYL